MLVALEYTQQGRNVEAKTYDILQSQIWSLLPGFCKDPVDVCPGFKGMARILGSALSDRPDLRHDVCLAIRHLITRNMDNGKGSSVFLSGGGVIFINTKRILFLHPSRLYQPERKKKL